MRPDSLPVFKRMSELKENNDETSSSKATDGTNSMKNANSQTDDDSSCSSSSGTICGSTKNADSQTEAKTKSSAGGDEEGAAAEMEKIVRPTIARSDSKKSDDGRYCWVCFATDEDDEIALWCQPCKCRGTTKWVHQSCLQRWVDEKQKGNSFKRVNCPQCQTEYLIVFPKLGAAVNLLESIDSMIKRVSPFLAAGVIVGSLYWTAVTYGAITVLQVVGHKEGLVVMENADPFVLLIGLPAIPIGLILGRMIRWEDMILRLIQNRRNVKLPLLSLILPVPEEVIDGNSADTTAIFADPVSATRILCGALLLPTISSIFGRVFFESIPNNLHRTLIGGLTFVVIKGVLKIYYKQQQFSRKKQRTILDYTEENLRKFNTRENLRAGTAVTLRNVGPSNVV